MKSKQLRILLLIFTFASITLVVGKLILDPNIGKRRLAAIVFPETVPLDGWKLQANKPFVSRTTEDKQTIGKPLERGRSYQYSQNNQLLDIETIYELDSFGEYKLFLRNYSALNAAPSEQFFVVRKQPGVGTYGMYLVQDRAYLTACINSQGGSTLTRQQFESNRINNDLLGDRTIPWLMGKSSLRDTRCLWSHFSLPLNKSSPQATYAVLEKAWFSWYQWWVLHYPQE